MSFRFQIRRSLFPSRAHGFSLVELMVVVAIIGILSSIAIPSFRKFQARSRTTEAKLQLAAIYTAEASFFSTYQIYHTCLNTMGYDPTEFRNQRYYAIGFTVPASVEITSYAAAENLDLNASSCPRVLAPTTDLTFFEAGQGVGSSIATSAYIPSTLIGDQTIPQMTYVAGAGGIIYKDFTGDSNASAFTINERKQIFNIRSGY